MCDSTYEYEPVGVGGVGSGSALAHVEGEPKGELGFKAAARRGNDRREPVKVRIERTRK